MTNIAETQNIPLETINISLPEYFYSGN